MFGFVNSIINSIQYIWNSILAFAQLVINIITSLINFISHIPEYNLVLNNAILVLPTILIPFALAFVSIYIILFFIGR